MSDYVDDFCEYLLKNRNRSAATINAYRPILLRLEKYLESLSPPLDFQAASLQNLEMWAGPVLHKEGLDVRTRVKAISALRGFFDFMVRRGLLAESPARQLYSPKIPATLPEVVTLDQAEQLIWAPDLATLKGLRDAAILALLIGAGCRVSGIRNINEEDLFRQEINGQTWLFVKLREKGCKERIVPLPKLAELPVLMFLGHPDRAALDDTRHHLRVGETKILFFGMRPGSCPIHEWSGERRRLTAKSINTDILKLYGRPLGIPDKVLHPHALRHLYGTHLFDEHIDKEVRKSVMGHERDETLSIYTRLSRKRTLDVAGKHNPLEAISTPFDDLVAAVDKTHKPRKRL